MVVSGIWDLGGIVLMGRDNLLQRKKKTNLKQ
jgi:hypothetical protein